MKLDTYTSGLPKKTLHQPELLQAASFALPAGMTKKYIMAELPTGSGVIRSLQVLDS